METTHEATPFYQTVESDKGQAYYSESVIGTHIFTDENGRVVLYMAFS